MTNIVIGYWNLNEIHDNYWTNFGIYILQPNTCIQ